MKRLYKILKLFLETIEKMQQKYRDFFKNIFILAKIEKYDSALKKISESILNRKKISKFSS